MSVEFLGLPASGKSTLASRVLQDLRTSGVDALSLQEALVRGVGEGVGDKLIDPLMSIMPSRMRSRYAESGFIRSPALLLSLVGFMAAHPNAVGAFLDGQGRRAEFEVGGEVIINWFLQLVARYEFARSRLVGNEILLLDEGFCQRVLTGFGVGFSKADHRDVERYLGSIPPPGLLVYFVPDREVVRDRLLVAAQGGNPSGRKSIYGTKRLDESGLDPRQFLTDCARTVEFVVGFAERAGWPSIGVQSGEELAVTSEKVIEVIGRPVDR